MRLILGNILVGLLCQSLFSADTSVHFADDIAPLLREHCLRCHAPGSRHSDLSLATFADLQTNDFVIPGSPESSYLLELVTSADGQPPEMPQEGKPLSQAEVDLLRQWIIEGAVWPQNVVVKPASKVDASWWSLQPLFAASAAKAIPTRDAVANESAASATIDDFILAELAKQGLKLNPPADRRTLIRRASYDLLGLPPTPEEVEAFVSDSSPQAYERLVDRLLASPHYGERWGRHWLDVVRFGESIGFERNVIVDDIWPFRDYVIRSLNDDKPFDQLIREHLAGDVIAADNPDVVVGSAFLVAGPYDDVGNQDAAQAAQIRANTLDEIISATGQAFLGMTLGCARCHDHKFDPITQQDYYGLYATFSGIRHGAVPLATTTAMRERDEKLEPLQERKAELETAKQDLKVSVLERAYLKLDDFQAQWTRPPVDRTGTEERFEPVVAKFIRLVCEAQDSNPTRSNGFGIDEFEVWSAIDDSVLPIDSERNRPDDLQAEAQSSNGQPVNVALASHGGKATGEARSIEDFPGAYGPQLAIDGKTGARFISVGDQLSIELREPTLIERVVFSSARDEETPEQPKFVFVADYRIEISVDGNNWREVAHSRDRKPVGSLREFVAARAASAPNHLEHRLLEAERTDDERLEEKRLRQEIASVNRLIAEVPDLPHVWIGKRVAQDAQGPFHVFLGGSPQKPGEEVVPSSLAVFSQTTVDASNVDASNFGYQLAADAPESQRRIALADWIVDPRNPLAPRVLANRVWHYHFGTGIVDTPSDFGYMGGRPSHPELLDFLARQLLENGWKIKALHRMIMNSKAYRQSSAHHPEAAAQDGDARLLWRFPPRRLAAEEIRDTILQAAGKLDETMGGPGFRLYHFMQDNVCTYDPLDSVGPETYRRAVYHQNARASVVDLMTDFDQPDCAFSAPRRATTVTPLQALTMLNHSFTLDMARAMAERLTREAGEDPEAQMQRAFQLCYAREPAPEETSDCIEHMQEFGLTALCRILLNTSEMIYVE